MAKFLTEENLNSGGFYFDRKIVTPYLSNSYIPSREQRILLLKKIENYRKEFFSPKGINEEGRSPG